MPSPALSCWKAGEDIRGASQGLAGQRGAAIPAGQRLGPAGAPSKEACSAVKAAGCDMGDCDKACLYTACACLPWHPALCKSEKCIMPMLSTNCTMHRTPAAAGHKGFYGAAADLTMPPAVTHHRGCLTTWRRGPTRTRRTSA